MPELLVVSLNLRGIHDRWWKREPLVVRGLAELKPDVICLQEAATWFLQARWLAWRLSRATGRRYHTVQARKRGWRGISEGLAILSRQPMGRHARLPLGGGERVAQRIVVSIEGASLAVANAHLEHRSHGGQMRRQQVRSICRWLETLDEPIVLAGDFNDTPESPALQALAAGFRPAHPASGPQLAGTYPSWAPSRVIDYILVTAKVEVVGAGICLDTPTNGAWPSDHIGLWARLRF